MSIIENKISVIIPAFNEEGAISKVIADLKKLSIIDEIIVIDDGSTDSTKQKAIESGARVISHQSNCGYGASLKTGIFNAKNDILAFVDADAQHNPDDLNVMNEYIAHHDMIIGARNPGSHSPLWRKPGKFMISMLANYLAGYKIPDLNCGFRLVKRKAILPYINIFPDKFSFSTTSTIFFIKDGLKVKFVPINVKKRIGESSLRIHHGLDTIILVLRMITLFEPLKIFLPVSIAIFVFGFLWALQEYIVYSRFGATSLFLGIASLLVFFFGLIADQIATIRKENLSKLLNNS
jgi:glycosyltransferase involved in cell wall biosynthesis